MADLALWEVKLKEPSDRAAASPEEVEADVDGRSGSVEGDWGTVTELTLCEEPWRETVCRLNCRALASAFSCVRTKLANC